MAENNKKLIEGIINAAKDSVASNKGLSEFINQFYDETSAKLLASYTPEQLFSVVKSAYDFANGRKESRRIRVFNPDINKDGYKSDRTIVETNLNDIPFLLDSLTTYLYDNGHSIHEVFHPIMFIERDASGQINNVININDTAAREKAQAESLIHIEISHIATNDELNNIVTGIEAIIEHVQLAVNDWHTMESKAQEVITRLEKTKGAQVHQEDITESVEFLRWALDNNFIFLGYRDYDFEKKSISLNKKTQLGIFKSHAYQDNDEQTQHIPINSSFILEGSYPLEITKSTRRSIVHRHAPMDYISIKKYDSKGNIIGEERFIGLFTSSVYFQSTNSIPIIRKKIRIVIERAGFRQDSHNSKTLVAVLESHPRDELLQTSSDDLFRIGMGIVSLSERPQTRLFLRRDRFMRFFSCIIYIPREFFTTHIREAIQSILEEELGGKVMDYYTQVTDSNLARVNVLIKTVSEDNTSDYLLSTNEQQKMLSIDEAKLESRIAEKTNSWINSLNENLQRELGELRGETLYRAYYKSFPEGYKSNYSSVEAAKDISKMEHVYQSNDIAVDLVSSNEEGVFQLKLFRLDDKITLSEILPVIENMGFQAVDEVTFNLKPKNYERKIWLHNFKLKLISSELIKLAEVKSNFEEALKLIWQKKIENDALNQLILMAGLNYRSVEVVRAYCKYLIQIRFPYSYSFITSVIAKNSQITKLLVELFYSHFDISFTGDRVQKSVDVSEKVKAALKNVSSVLEDRVLTQLFHTINATIRTNFFQKDASGNNKPYISYKFDSAKVPNMPLPVMFAEIFVYSYDVEGIHLRAGKVARGGLRWSDRHEDFRTEILGLVKAQHVKNSVIVPVGSKGGFVVKNPVQGSREAYMAQGQDCYRNYLRGLLDITDNIIDGKVVHPQNVVIRDVADPYLVVAADKGTASFSDIANDVAAEYKFWLDDAFASGGSVGYDHKKMAITARGAWVSVRRHFAEMGKDIDKETFTVVGIGDMSGDVFGNGMLLSENIALVGAFNHMHIFIDPTPNTAKSFKERARLFVLPRSTWADYDAKLISKGGGIFERSAKTIPVSAEMAKLYNITTPEIAPDDLIRKLLTANVELLWNGGIGTYAKSSFETNEQVGDKSNDAVRVNGFELNCKIIGEGGNLGFTQLGRIEYATKGGRINTDAIDNSAGVDCSDHEVNIKIGLREAVNTNKISVDERNKVLEEMTDEVAKLVLRDNELQTLALTIAENQKSLIIEDNMRLMEYLEGQRRLNRAIEFLPTNEKLNSRILNKQGFTRPELSVLLAYSKLYVFDDLIVSKLPDDPYLDSDLLLYFPTLMRNKFLDEIKGHQLRREIITTFVSNSIVNRMGTTFFTRMKAETGMKGCDVARAYTVVRDSFQLRELWEEIEKVSSSVSLETSMDLYNEISLLVEKACGWFLRNSTQPLNTSGLVESYLPSIKELSTLLDEVINPVVRETRNKKLTKYKAANVPDALAQRIANLEPLASACDIVLISQKTGLPLKIVGSVYFDLGWRLEIGWLRNEARGLIGDNHWDNLALRSLIDAFYDQQMRITVDVLKDGCKDDKCDLTINSWATKNEKSIARFNSFISELKKQDKITQSMLTIGIQKVVAILTDA